METILTVKPDHQIGQTEEIDFANLDQIREIWKKEEAKKRSYRVIISKEIMSENQFFRYIEAFGSIAMIQQNDRSKFIIDENNIDIIRNLYLYTTYNKQCSWNLDKGILFVGPPGTGKSVLLNAYCMILQKFAESPFGQRIGAKVFKFEAAQDVFNEIVTNQGKLPLRLINTGLCLDELGREPKRLSNYGNEFTPIIDLLLARYSRGLPTFGTSNFGWETLSSESVYGNIVGDRMVSMFSFVEMLGKSKRK